METVLNFLDDLFRGGDSDQIAENPWKDGQGPRIETPSGDADRVAENPWANVPGDSWLR
jgi:hypothetical protein